MEHLRVDKKKLRLLGGVCCVAVVILFFFCSFSVHERAGRTDKAGTASLNPLIGLFGKP